ncbi:MAG: pilus assembly protein [Nocardioidaceae bacterium]|nr:pilus assembly protein [Nocardioidaceae bacterium]
MSDQRHHGQLGRRNDDGSVTAEAAVVLPLVAAFALVLVWMISVGIAQVQVVDAARDAARALARGDDEAVALHVAERTAPDHATVASSRSGGTVTVTVSSHQDAPAWLLVPLPDITLESRATVDTEDRSDTS